MESIPPCGRLVVSILSVSRISESPGLLRLVSILLSSIAELSRISESGLPALLQAASPTVSKAAINRYFIVLL